MGVAVLRPSQSPHHREVMRVEDQRHFPVRPQSRQGVRARAPESKRRTRAATSSQSSIRVSAMSPVRQPQCHVVHHDRRRDPRLPAEPVGAPQTPLEQPLRPNGTLAAQLDRVGQLRDQVSRIGCVVPCREGCGPSLAASDARGGEHAWDEWAGGAEEALAGGGGGGRDFGRDGGNDLAREPGGIPLRELAPGVLRPAIRLTVTRPSAIPQATRPKGRPSGRRPAAMPKPSSARRPCPAPPATVKAMT